MPSSRSIVVVSLLAAAPGPRFRLTYRLGTDGIIAGSFEIAPPGKPDAFGPYLTWSLKSAGKAA